MFASLMNKRFFISNSLLFSVFFTKILRAFYEKFMCHHTHPCLLRTVAINRLYISSVFGLIFHMNGWMVLDCAYHMYIYIQYTYNGIKYNEYFILRKAVFRFIVRARFFFLLRFYLHFKYLIISRYYTLRAHLYKMLYFRHKGTDVRRL